MNSHSLIAFTGYLCLVFGVAIVAYFITKNLSDFVLGGRRLSGPVAALSAGASDMSAWLLLGLPGAVFTLGLNQIWLPIGLTTGAYLSWRILAKPIRVYSELANDSLTLPAFLENRFLDTSGGIRVALAIVTLVFFAFYTASGLVGGALLLQRFGIANYHDALYLGAGIIMLYTMVGGFLAVSWTDFAQGILMFFCLLIVPCIASYNLGGVEPTMNLLNEVGEHFFHISNELNALLLINLLAWGIGYFGQPHIIVRYMAVKKVSDIPIARRICVTWMFFSMIGAVFTGLVGAAYYFNQDINPESVFIVFSQELFHPIIGGALMAAILSSIMCAIDSQMLASSSALSEDIYHRVIRRNASQKELVFVSRLAIVVLAIIAIQLASNPEGRIIHIVAFAWAGLASAFAPSILCAVFWGRTTAKGVLLGVLLGTLSCIVWHMMDGGIFELYEIIPGFIIGLLSVVLGSLVDKPPSKAVQELHQKAWQSIRAS